MKQHSILTRSVFAGLFIVIMLMGSIAPVAASSSAYSSQSETIVPLVFIFGESFEEQSAVSDLSENFPNSLMVHIDNPDELTEFSSWSGIIIWVGHGNDEGLLNNENIISWDFVSDFIKVSDSDYHFLLSCASGIVTSLTINTGKYVYGFETYVDALFGSSIISILISRLFGLGNFALFVQKAISRLDLTPDDEKYQGMYIIGRLGTNEAIVRGINAVLLFSAIFFTLSAAIMGGTISSAFTTYVLVGGASWMLYLIMGIFTAAANGDAVGIVGKLSAFIVAFFAFGDFVLSVIAWYLAVALAAALGADLAATPPKMPMYPAIIILAVGASIIEVIKFIDDYNDYGDIPR